MFFGFAIIISLRFVSFGFAFVIVIFVCAMAARRGWNGWRRRGRAVVDVVRTCNTRQAAFGTPSAIITTSNITNGFVFFCWFSVKKKTTSILVTLVGMFSAFGFWSESLFRRFFTIFLPLFLTLVLRWFWFGRIVALAQVQVHSTVTHERVRFWHSFFSILRSWLVSAQYGPHWVQCESVWMAFHSVSLCNIESFGHLCMLTSFQ